MYKWTAFAWSFAMWNLQYLILTEIIPNGWVLILEAGANLASIKSPCSAQEKEGRIFVVTNIITVWGGLYMRRSIRMRKHI